MTRLGLNSPTMQPAAVATVAPCQLYSKPGSKKISEIAHCEGRKRAHQIFTAWAFAGHNHGPLIPKSPGSSTPDGSGSDGDLAIQGETAILAYTRLFGPVRGKNARLTLMSRHRDGIEPPVGGMLEHDCETCYKIALNLERYGQAEKPSNLQIAGAKR